MNTVLLIAVILLGGVPFAVFMIVLIWGLLRAIGNMTRR